jgi:hypothetical protein
MKRSCLWYGGWAVLVMSAGCGSEKNRPDEAVQTVVTIFRSDEANIPNDCGALLEEDWVVESPGTTDIPTAAIRRALEGVAPSKRLHRPGTVPLLEYYRGVRVEAGTAIVMFESGALEYLNNAACAQMAVKAPISRTLLGLPGISGVEYEIDGSLFREWDA